MSEEVKKSDIAEKDVLKYVIDGFKQASEEAQKYNAIIAESAKINKAILAKGTKLGNAKEIKEVEQAVNAANSAFVQFIKNETLLNNVEKASLQAKRLLNKEVELQAKATERAAQKEQQLSSVYSAVSTKLNNMIKEYRDLAIRKDLGLKLTDKEAQKYEFLKGKIEKYDTALKATDASSGRYQRNVGNYASATNNLGFAFSQLTREAPAFANSMQTGFMAISNNLPIFFDEITRAKNGIDELRKSGQKTPSMFKTMVGAIATVQTGLSVFITALTVLGPKIIDAFLGTEISALRQEMLNKAIERAGKLTQDYIKVLEKQQNWDKLTRKEAIEKVKQQIKEADLRKQEIKDSKELLEGGRKTIKSNIGLTVGLKDKLPVYDALISKEQVRIEQQNEVIRGLREYLEQLELAEYQDSKKIEKTKKQNEVSRRQIDYLEYEIELLKTKNELSNLSLQTELDILESQINAEKTKRVEQARQTGVVENEVIEGLLKEQSEKRLQLIEKQYADEKAIRDLELKQKLQDLNAQYDEEAKQLKEAGKSTAETEKNREKEIALIYQNFHENEILQTKKQQEEVNNITKEGAEERKDIIDDLNKAQEEYAQSEDKRNKKSIKNQKTLKELFKLSLDYFIKQSERKIDQIDKEINKAQEQYNYLQELAKNGNISAQQSLAEQQKVVNEANQKKIKEQKRIESLKLAETGYDIYSSKVEAGDKTPLLSTIKDLTLLNQFINSLPSFDVGTENTGKNGKGVDGKGGFQAILHPNERVMTSEQNAKVGSMTNNDLADLAWKHNTGQLTTLHKLDHVGTSWDLIPLAKELKEIKTAIQEKPETNIGIGEITQSMMMINHEMRKGNKTVRKQYRINRS